MDAIIIQILFVSKIIEWKVLRRSGMETRRVKAIFQSVSCLLKTAGFGAVLILLLFTVSNILTPKQLSLQDISAKGFYYEPKNSIDILAIGDSTLYCGLAPMELWKRYGYAAYISGEANQTAAMAYENLREALTCQSPLLVVLEVNELFDHTFDKMVNNAAATQLKRIFPGMQYIPRWKSLTIDDFISTPVISEKSQTKGFNLSTETDGYIGAEYMVPTNTKAPIELMTRYYLSRIISLCNKKHAQLVFVSIPNAKTWNYAKHNSVEACAAKYHIPFLDMNLNCDSFGFDWKANTRDKGGHLNVSGAQRATAYFGEFVSANFRIPNRRDESRYDGWSAQLAEYEVRIKLKNI